MLFSITAFAKARPLLQNRTCDKQLPASPVTGPSFSPPPRLWCGCPQLPAPLFLPSPIPSSHSPLLCRPLQLVPPGSARLHSQISPSSFLSHPRVSSLQQRPLTWKRPPALLCSPPTLSSAAGSASQLHPQWHFVTVGGWWEGVAWPGPQRSEQSSGERSLPHPTPPNLALLVSLTLWPNPEAHRLATACPQTQGTSHLEP